MRVTEDAKGYEVFGMGEVSERMREKAVVLERNKLHQICRRTKVIKGNGGQTFSGSEAGRI